MHRRITRDASQALVELRLGRNELGRAGSAALAAWLRRAPVLEVLDVRGAPTHY